MTSWLPKLRNRAGPRYLAIVEVLADDIESGRVLPGTQLLPHRELAERLKLSVGTVSKALAEAERRGLISGEVGRGTFVRGKRAAGNGRAEANGAINLTLNIPPASGADEALRDAMQDLSSDASITEMINYLPHQGIYAHRDKISGWFRKQGVQCAAEQIFITSGAQHAAWLAITSMAKEGDTIAAECLPYSGLLSLADLSRYRLCGIDMDHEGATPASLDQVLSKNKPRIVYLTPTLQTATGAVMSMPRRRQIAEVIRAHDSYLVEDDVYSFLSDQPLAPISSIIPERSFYITSFAKCVAPALRVGAVIVPDAFHSRAITALRSSSWMTSPILVEILARILGNGALDTQVQRKRTRARRLQEAVRRILGDSATAGGASFHYWLTLPSGYSESDFAAQASVRGINMASSQLIAGSSNFSPGLRLCLGAVDDDRDLERALNAIAALVSRREFISLF
jgi:DNA-binding transcriptional MocR family regulator